MNDPRFHHVTSDPRFKRVPRHKRKVRVDSRFQHMFSDKRFKVQYNVDKRGRKVKQTSSDDLRKYYHLEENKGDSLDKEEAPGNQESDEEEATGNQEFDDEEAPYNQESDDESEWECLSDNDQVIHDWGGVSGVEIAEQTSRRLAVCSMDWDRINAHDIYVLASSFKPSGGCVLSVRVYPSDFGRQRMREEEIAGPPDLVSNDNDTTEGPGYSQEKLRQYQLNRLRYYYAVIECDCVGTAEYIYQECDGLEYEHSGGQLDLRFVPDEMEFDDREAVSEATESTLPLNFTPSQFVNTALQQSKVQLTWDETDPHRLKSTMRKFSKEDAVVMDFSAYLASDGEESIDEDKYKTLLERDKRSTNPMEEMEITWEPGLKESAEQLVKRRKREVKNEKVTQWEKYLHEKQQKKKEKRLKRKTDSPPDEKNGFEDEFFQQGVTTATAKSSKKKRKLQKQPSSSESAELELLVMDSDDKAHFNYKEIGDNGFDVDVSDPRFEALYHSHLFAPDPAHPQFKNNKGMEAIMREKMRRREKKTTQSTDLSLEPLVRAVKRKTRAFKRHKKN